jgi:hypothetical protein
MNDTYTFYNLYCVNMHCNQSIYHRTDPTQILFSEDNLLSVHYCERCNQPMTSAMEMEIEYITAGAGIRLPGKPFHDASY